MPRAETTKVATGTQPYQTTYENSPSPSSSSSTGASSSAAKKKHICTTCDRSFTTSGHLARHSRIHTGERNHKCPFPGCETRCSRQDNLQQHYRIHLSPGSRRSSARSARNTTNGSGSKRTRAVSAASSESVSSDPSPPLSPPPLEPARVYSHEATPPDSPPPLAHATLPATAQLHRSTTSSRGSMSASPETNYATLSQDIMSMSSTNMGSGQQQYTYRMNPGTGYQDDSQPTSYGYSLASSTSSNPGSFSSYSSHQDYQTHQPVSHLSSSSLHQVHTRDSSPTSNLPSRHSISHISHPQSYASQSGLNSPSPGSSQSVSSHASCPPTPTYPVYNDDGSNAHVNASAAYQQQASMLADSHIANQSHLVHGNYPLHADTGRFESPPPILAPIQDGRYTMRRESMVERQITSHHSTPYIHHPQPLSTEFGYHQSMNLGHQTWKMEGGMRKGLGALVG